jgi:transcriptional antiterminator
MDAKSVWGKIIQYRRKLFPNICLMVELLLCLGMSNSTVESGFSHLTAMLRDNRLSLKHRTMENLLIIKINDLVWNNEEREDILESALNHFLQKRRKIKLENVGTDHVRADITIEAESELQDDEKPSTSESDDDDFAMSSGGSDVEGFSSSCNSDSVTNIDQ